MTQAPPSTSSSGGSRATCPPRLWVTRGEGAGDYASDVADVARLAGYELLPWQVDVLRVWSAHDADGQWLHRRNGASVPRQSGKSVDGIVWSLFLAVIMGYKVLWTDHNYNTTCEMLGRFRKILGLRPGDGRGVRAFNAQVTDASAKTSQENFQFRSGGVIAFSTRTQTAGLGFSFDAVVYDEAQELRPEHVQAIAPTTTSGAKHNLQFIYLGTPTRAGSSAPNFLNMRNEAASEGAGDDLSWVEWGASEVGDVLDESRLYAVNPSLGPGRADINAIRSGIKSLLPDELAAAQEYLGYWMPAASANACLPAGSWEAREVAPDAAQTDGKLAYGVKFSPDGKTVALSAALAERGGPSYVELVDFAGTSRGTAWLSAWLIARRDRCACVVIDGRSGAGALAQRLREGGMRRPGMVVECNPSGVQAAAAMLLDEVRVGTLSHIASPALDESSTRSVRRPIGTGGGFGFGDGPNSTSVPVESASLALWGARTSKRDPRRRQRVSW